VFFFSKKKADICIYDLTKCEGNVIVHYDLFHYLMIQLLLSVEYPGVFFFFLHMRERERERERDCKEGIKRKEGTSQI
jgi:hypothetical protein